MRAHRAAQADDGDLARAPADIDNHVAGRILHRQTDAAERPGPADARKAREQAREDWVEQIAARQDFLLAPKGAADTEGFRRWRCPAEAGTVRCPIKPKSLEHHRASLVPEPRAEGKGPPLPVPVLQNHQPALPAQHRSAEPRGGILQHLPDVKRWVKGGGRARIVVHDPEAATAGSVRVQLDTNTDFLQDLERSLTALARHAEPGRLDYRLLPLNPGFSIVVVNPGQRSGRVILELHGFQDPKVGDRMHIEIRRTESVPWFEYWAGRFEAIWDAAREPGADGRVALNRVPADRTDNPEARPQ